MKRDARRLVRQSYLYFQSFQFQVKMLIKSLLDICLLNVADQVASASTDSTKIPKIRALLDHHFCGFRLLKKGLVGIVPEQKFQGYMNFVHFLEALLDECFIDLKVNNNNKYRTLSHLINRATYFLKTGGVFKTRSSFAWSGDTAAFVLELGILRIRAYILSAL